MEKALTISSLGPYAVEARIGSGGMGVVYSGRHQLSGKRAALKTVHVTSPEQIAAFRREVQVLAELSHPGIVRILEQGLSSGTPWYAMELVEGRALSTLLRGPLASETEVVLGSGQRGTAPLTEDVRPTRAVLPRPESGPRYRDRPPLSELLTIVRKVCKALGFLHAHGLVHRDLKPDNILIQPDGNPVLVDFGIVGHFGDKAGREVLKLTRQAGTLAYMAPEQALGRLVDARADLFSLGCILYECIVDELPFGPSGLYDLSLPPPALPSTRVEGVSPELDRLVMALLAKDVRERVGYAADVADALARLDDSARPDSSPQAAAAYLYRPEFAGRQAALERLYAVLERTRQGSRQLALITGESGLGKTRLGLELGARAVATGMTVLTGECVPVGATRNDEGARGEPLHPFRHFLLAVADACRVGGLEVARRLLEPHGAVLAPYEPALAAVLPADAAPPEPLAPERARARVFAALEGLLSAFAAERPLLLLLDDLHWADSLSLDFLGQLAGRDAAGRFALIATCRSEEMNAELVALSAHPFVHNEQLDRFDRAAVGEMVSGMLALNTPPSDWVAFLEEESGGNPFFIAEYLRAAIAERLLTRTTTGRWTLGAVGEGVSLRERLGLPANISALVGRRLRGLDEGSLCAVRAAAVLGRDFDLALLSETAQLDLAQITGSFARLRQRQILEDDATGGVSFVHDKLREIAYGLLEAGERAALHGRAASALEARHADNDALLDFGSLGHHHAQAGHPERAARWFEKAAERALKSYANRDAIRFYRLALAELGRFAAPLLGEQARLQEALGEVLLLTADIEQATAAFNAALAATGNAERVARARRLRLLARTSERRHQHEPALAFLAEAQRELDEPPAPGEPSNGYWFERVQSQIQSVWHLYFLSRVDELSARIEEIRPLIEEHGAAAQRVQFFQALVHMNARRDRYVIGPETIALARASLSAAEQTGDADELALARFLLAFMLSFAGGEAEAEPLFVVALQRAERVGDAALQARYLSYFTIMHRRLGRTAEVHGLATRALELAQKHGFFDYVGVAFANLAWVALCAGQDAVTPAEQALAAWQRLPATYPYPLQWLARAPLATALTRDGRFAEALRHWRYLLEPTQARLPDELVAAIEQALATSDASGPSDAASLTRVVEAARAFAYI